jgi:hypothetical protein
MQDWSLAVTLAGWWALHPPSHCHQRLRAELLPNVFERLFGREPCCATVANGGFQARNLGCCRAGLGRLPAHTNGR